MKVSEALAERADVVRRMGEVKSRATRCARYQEGEEPQESALVLLERYLGLAKRLQVLTTQLNVTNLSTVLPNGMTVTAAIARRDVLSVTRKAVTEIADAAGPESDRYGFGRRRSELASKTDLRIPDLRQQADDLAREYQELDNMIQASNFATDLAG